MVSDVSHLRDHLDVLTGGCSRGNPWKRQKLLTAMGAGCVPSEFNLAHLVLFHFYFIIFFSGKEIRRRGYRL